MVSGGNALASVRALLPTCPNWKGGQFHTSKVAARKKPMQCSERIQGMKVGLPSQALPSRCCAAPAATRAHCWHWCQFEALLWCTPMLGMAAVPLPLHAAGDSSPDPPGVCRPANRPLSPLAAHVTSRHAGFLTWLNTRSVLHCNICGHCFDSARHEHAGLHPLHPPHTPKPPDPAHAPGPGPRPTPPAPHSTARLAAFPAPVRGCSPQGGRWHAEQPQGALLRPV